jgi:hypothetical protein
MQKMILAITLLLLTTLASVGVQAQTPEKKETDKKEGTTADAWRQALPEAEQPANAVPVYVMEESTDNVETRETEAQIEKRILDLEGRLVEALKKRDSVALKQLLADDFIPAGMNITELQSDKNRYIEWALKSLELKSYTVEKTTVRSYRTSAVVTVHYKRQAIVAGAPSDGDFIATNVWVRRGKIWQAVAQHVSPLPKPAMPDSRPAPARKIP